LAYGTSRKTAEENYGGSRRLKEKEVSTVEEINSGIW